MNLFGLYVPGHSLFHRIGAGPKYLIMIVLTLPAAVLRPYLADDVRGLFSP